MTDLSTAIALLIGLFVVGMCVFLISENRRPQATLAWLLAFLFLPGVGLLIYILFGRSTKAFSKRSKLLMQDLEANARPILSPVLSRQDTEIAKLESESISHRKLMTLVRRNSQSVLTRRNCVEIKQNAAQFYPSLMEDMMAARHSIHHQYFIWRSDSFTEKLKNILTDKARAGVAVRLLYDPIGATPSRSYIQEMKAAGVKIAPTSPRFHLHTISYRNHRKISVIDGKIGYTGGMNIGQEHIDGGEGFNSWRDTQIRVTGEAAGVLQAVFMVDWYNAYGENLFSAAYFPGEVNEAPVYSVPVQVLTSGPDSQWAAIRQLYSGMIISAERRVRLQSPYFILDATMAEAVTAAAMAGVDVQVMLSARPSGNRLPDWAGKTFIVDVVEAGVTVFLYQKGYLHAKTISIDGKICSIGSANIDIRSFSINYEINAVLYDARLASQLEHDFDQDLPYCTMFDPKTYRRCNPAIRFRDSVARLFAPLL